MLCNKVMEGIKVLNLYLVFNLYSFGHHVGYRPKGDGNGEYKGTCQICKKKGKNAVRCYHRYANGPLPSLSQSPGALGNAQTSYTCG